MRVLFNLNMISCVDSMRKRKARKLSEEQQSSPLQDIINDSMALVQDIHSMKSNQFRLFQISFVAIKQYFLPK